MMRLPQRHHVYVYGGLGGGAGGGDGYRSGGRCHFRPRRNPYGHVPTGVFVHGDGCHACLHALWKKAASSKPTCRCGGLHIYVMRSCSTAADQISFCWFALYGYVLPPGVWKRDNYPAGDPGENGMFLQYI